MKADTQVYQALKQFIIDSELEIVNEKEENYYNRIDVKSGKYRCNVNVFNSGKVVIGGQNSPLKTALEQAKTEVEGGNFSPLKSLPFEIDKFPEIIQERIPDCDPVIIAFIEEAIKALRADLLLSCVFLVGAASEKAICILIDCYANAIQNEDNKAAFKERVDKSRMVSRKYDEFLRSYKSCKTKPTTPKLKNDSFYHRFSRDIAI